MSAHDPGHPAGRQRPRGAAPAPRRAQVAEAIGPGLARAALAARVNGDGLGPRPAARGRHHGSPSSPSATPRRSTCCATRRRTSWPRPCASCSRAPGSASARRSRTASTTTSRSPGRSRPRISARFEAEMRRGRGRELSVRARGGGPRRGATPLRRRPAQARAHRRAGRRRDHHALHRRAVHRPVPRPARARHRPAQALQAAPRGRRVLARRRRKRQMLQRIYGTALFKKEDLDAYLHRIEEAKKRDHRKLGKRARPVHVPPVRARAPRSGPSAARRSTTLLNEYMRELTSATATRRSRRRCSTTRGCGRLRPLGQVPREHVPGARQRDRRARLLAQADELPVALPAAIGIEEAQLPRAAAALRHTQTCCTATRLTGALGGPHPRAPVPAGRRHIFLHARTRSPTRSQLLVQFILERTTTRSA